MQSLPADHLTLPSLSQQPLAPTILNRRLLSSSNRALCRKSSATVLFLCQPRRCLPQPLPNGPTASALLLRGLSQSLPSRALLYPTTTASPHATEGCN
ncbi:hypothetical protein BHE74_00015087 [Ensete ventricosum]|nr:hypothetical protein BHE74_00015087 [Ensete ventricosum]